MKQSVILNFNISNLIILNTSNCSIPHTSKSFDDFARCYDQFASKKKLEQILGIMLIVSGSLTNLAVILLIYLRSIKFSYFDKILVNHCIIQGVTALVDIPFFHINRLPVRAKVIIC